MAAGDGKRPRSIPPSNVPARELARVPWASSLGRSAQAVLLELAIQRGAADAELSHGSCHVAARALQSSFDGEALELTELHGPLHQHAHWVVLVHLGTGRRQVVAGRALVE